MCVARTHIHIHTHAHAHTQVQFLTSEAPHHHSLPSHRAAQWQHNRTQWGVVGFEVSSQQAHNTSTPAFTIVAIDQLMDLHGTCQGQAGYLNHLVSPGDVLVSINGEAINTADTLQRMLCGPPCSVLTMTLTRSRNEGENLKGGREYCIQIQRMYNDKDKGPPAATRREPRGWHSVTFLCLQRAQVDSWSLSHLGYLYPGTTPVIIKLDHNRSCPWV